MSAINKGAINNGTQCSSQESVWLRVLQYVGSRTEYKRDVQIELQMDYTDLHYASGRGLVTQKPSIVEPTRTQLRELIKSVSPEQEPGVRKYFINAPNESWSPKTGSYSFSISWTYELDR